MSYFSIIRYDRLGSYFQYYDLAIFEQSYWTTVHNGTLLYNSVMGISHFGAHNSPMLFTVLPFYYLFQTPETLLVFQAVIIALAAIPLFYLAKEILDERYAIVIVLMYMLFPQLHGAILFEFHEACFIPIFIFTALYFLYRKNIPVFVLLMSLSLLIKEDMPVLVIPIFIYALYKQMYSMKFEKWLIVIGIVLASIWLLVSILVIIPSFSPGGTYIHETRFDTGDIPTMVIQYPISKATYLLSVFTPLLFLPLLSPGTMFIMFPALLEIMLQNDEFRFTTSLHYVVQLIPLLFLSVILGFKRVQNHIHPKNTGFLIVLLLMVTGVCLVSSEVSPLSNRYYFNTPNDHIGVVYEGMSMVPEGSSLYLGSSYIKDSTHRMELNVVYTPGMEYLLIDNKSFKFNKTDFFQYDLLQYTEIFNKEGVQVYRKKQLKK